MAQHRRRRHAASTSAPGGTRRSAHADHHGIVADPALQRHDEQARLLRQRRRHLHDHRRHDGRQRCRRCRASTAGRSSTTPTASRSSTAAPATRTAARSSAARRTTARSASRRPRAARRGPTMFGGDGGWCAADPADPNGLLRRVRVSSTSTAAPTAAPRHAATYISGQFWDAHASGTGSPCRIRIPDAMNQQRAVHRAVRARSEQPEPHPRRRRLAVAHQRREDAQHHSTGPGLAAIKPSVGTRDQRASPWRRATPTLIWVGHERRAGLQDDATARRRRRRVAACRSHRPAAARRRRGTAPRITIDPLTYRHRLRDLRRLHPGQRLEDDRRRRHLEQHRRTLLPEAPIRASPIHPRKSTALYLGTEVGLFASDDGGATWSPTNEGPTNCSVDELFWMNEIAGLRHARARHVHASTCQGCSRNSLESGVNSAKLPAISLSAFS